MALRTSQHMVDADEAAHPDLQAVAGQSIMPHLVGEHALVLRLSAHVKDPLQGFTFGRNVTRCDVCFHNDPMRRLSNIHFRIYLNEYGVLMLEDSSINGTVVDGTLLKARQGDRSKTGEKKLPKRRTINPGSKIQILMHEGQDDLDFIVQIPRREGDYEETYRRNLTRYMKRLQQIRAENEPVDAAKTITAGPGGHVSLKQPLSVLLWPLTSRRWTCSLSTKQNSRRHVPSVNCDCQTIQRRRIWEDCPRSGMAQTGITVLGASAKAPLRQSIK